MKKNMNCRFQIFFLSFLGLLPLLQCTLYDLNEVLLDNFDVTPYTSDETSSFRLIFCPDNMTTLGDASTLSACVCRSAFYNTPTGECKPCQVGTFKLNPGNHSCTSCPAHSTSLSGSKNITDCLCLSAFYRNNDDCYPCNTDQYKPFIANALCINCPAFTVSNKSSSQISDCKCLPGYQSTTAGCVKCPVGTHKNLAGNYECQLCPQNFYTIDQGSTSCVPCPLNSAMIQSNDNRVVESCKCIAGFEKSNDGTCTACETNFFCEGNDQKKPCTDFSISKAGSKSSLQCTCVAGYFLNQTDFTCQSCPPNFYCPFNTTLPKSCPANSYSVLHSFSVNNCTCLDGYT